MYVKAGAAAAAGGAATLPVTGYNLAWAVIFGVTLLVAGVALMRLVPRRRNPSA